MIKERLARQVDALILRMAPVVARIPVAPDHLTLMGGAVSLLAGVAYAGGEVVLGGVVLIVAGAFDLIDGIVARSQGVASPAGSFLDATLDRVSDLAVLSGIAVGMAAAADPWGAALACWALSGSVLTSYAKARAEVVLGELSVGLMERAERVLVIIFASLIDQLVFGLWIVALGASITAVQRIVIARRRLRALGPGTPATHVGDPSDDGAVTRASADLSSSDAL
jgi:phosphatidylglycerophosphate synthase